MWYCVATLPPEKIPGRGRARGHGNKAVRRMILCARPAATRLKQRNPSLREECEKGYALFPAGNIALWLGNVLWLF